MENAWRGCVNMKCVHVLLNIMLRIHILKWNVWEWMWIVHKKTTSWERPLKEVRKGDWDAKMVALAGAPPSHPFIFSTHARVMSTPDFFIRILFGEIRHAFLLSVSFHSVGDTDTVTARVDGHRARKGFKLLPAAVCVRVLVNLYQYTPAVSNPSPHSWLHCHANTGGALHKLLKFISHERTWCKTPEELTHTNELIQASNWVT